jgi:DNA repair protein RadC
MKKLKSNIDLLSLTKIKTDIPRATIENSQDANEYIRQFYFDDINIWESFFLLLLNTRRSTIGYAKISQGGVTSTVVDLRFIAKYIADTSSASIIIAHNHPSGDTKPSVNDIKVTEKVKGLMMYFDCVLLDHIILAEKSYYSFADNGNL